MLITGNVACYVKINSKDILDFSYRHNMFEECLVFPQNVPLDCKIDERCILGTDRHCIAKCFLVNDIDFGGPNDTSPLSVNPGNKIQNAGRSSSAFPGKKIEAQHCIICMFLCVGFFRKWRSMTTSKNDIYFCSARHIFPYWHMPSKIRIIR